jgi:hypothetical protein
MQKLFGVSLTTLAGYAGFFTTAFGSAAAGTVAIQGCPKWVPITFLVLAAVAGGLRIAVAHMTNDAPDPGVNSLVQKEGNHS